MKHYYLIQFVLMMIPSVALNLYKPWLGLVYVSGFIISDILNGIEYKKNIRIFKDKVLTTLNENYIFFEKPKAKPKLTVVK